MSRIGKQPIAIPDKVKVVLKDGLLLTEGPLGKFQVKVDPILSVEIKDGKVIVSRKDESKASRSRHGLVRNLIRNAVEGVSQGFKKDLDIIGVGFRAEVKGSSLMLTLGFSHQIDFPIPQGIKVVVEKQTHLTISGVDKELVGETAARVRRYREPEPYKGKGVKYTNEVIRRKVGKSAAGGK